MQGKSCPDSSKVCQNNAGRVGDVGHKESAVFPFCLATCKLFQLLPGIVDGCARCMSLPTQVVVMSQQQKTGFQLDKRHCGVTGAEHVFFLLQAVPDAETNGWKKPSPELEPKSPSSLSKPARPTPQEPQQTHSLKTASSSSSPDKQKSTPTPAKASATPATGKAAAFSSDKPEHRPGPVAYSSALADSSPSSIRTTAAKEHTSAGQNCVRCICVCHCPTLTCCMVQAGFFEV